MGKLKRNITSTQLVNTFRKPYTVLPWCNHLTKRSQFNLRPSATCIQTPMAFFAKWKRGEVRLSIISIMHHPNDVKVIFVTLKSTSRRWGCGLSHFRIKSIKCSANGRKSESKAFCFLWNIIDLLGVGTVSSSFKNIDVLFSLFFAN